MKKQFFKIVLFLFFCVILFCEEVQIGKEIENNQAIIEGMKLSSKDIKIIEENLKKNPNDLPLRAKLLGYYYFKSIKEKELRKTFQKNVLWIIKNAPESFLAGSIQCKLDPVIDKEAFFEGKKIWLENLEKYKESIKILENAANYFFVSEGELAENLYKKLQTLNPDNPSYYEKLGRLYSFEIKRRVGKEKKDLVEKSLIQYEKAYSLTEEKERFPLLKELAEISLEAENFKKAKDYSEKLLKKSKELSDNWNYGNAIHYANIVLGKIALKENRKEEAKKYLIEAGNTPGSPQLNSFGPDFSLAKELLEEGEKEVVLEYLKLCEKFWERGKEKLKEWQVLIKNGRIPEFWR